MPDTQKKWFIRIVAAILILLLSYLLKLNWGLFVPVLAVLNAIFFPFVVTGIFYYLLRPLVALLEKRSVPRSPAVLIVYTTMLLLTGGTVWLAGPYIARQFGNFAEQAPQMVSFVADGIAALQDKNKWLSPTIAEALPGLGNQIGSQWNHYAGSIAASLVKAFSWVSNTLFVLGLVPFMLYYVLKDGDRLATKLPELAPVKYRSRLPALLDDLDATMSAFIRGKALVSLAVGVMLLAGYSIIGLEYALVLACIGMLANVVPFFGPVIGAAPAMLVGLIQDPIKAVYVVVVTIIVQQIEGNFISPQVMGRSMDIHPLTVIVLIMGGGSVAGLPGVLFSVPAYAIVKVFFRHWRLLRNSELPQPSPQQRDGIAAKGLE